MWLKAGPPFVVHDASGPSGVIAGSGERADVGVARTDDDRRRVDVGHRLRMMTAIDIIVRRHPLITKGDTAP
jgi:hypothetical protein